MPGPPERTRLPQKTRDSCPKPLPTNTLRRPPSDDLDASTVPRNQLAWVGALLLVVFGVYAPSLANGYSFDGPLLAKATLPDGSPNAMTAGLRSVVDYFTAGYWDAYDGGHDRLYRPVTILSYALTNTISGGEPAFPHHLINVLLHVWATYLAYRLIARMCHTFWAPFLGACVFGMHALHSEVVAGIVGRAELFGFCFGAQAALLFARPARSNWPRVVVRIAVPLLLFLAYCSKENAVAWCPFLLVYAAAADWRDGRAPRVAEAVWAAGLSLLPLIAFLVLRDLAIGDRPEPIFHYLANPLAHVDTATRIRTAVMLWGFGIFKCLWPFTLTSDYSPVTFQHVESFADPRLIVAGAVLLAWLALGLYFVRRQPLLFLSVACFLGFGFAVSNIPFPIGIVFAERLFFTPTLGIAMLVAWIVGLGGDANSKPRKLLRIPLVVWLLVCAVTILQHNDAWNDNESRVLRDAISNPSSTRTLDKKARLLRDRGDLNGASAVWQEALRLDPNFLKGLSGYGTLLASQRRYAEAEQLLLRTLKVPAHYDAAPHVTRFNLYVLYEQMQQQKKALPHLRAAWQTESAFDRPHEPLIGPTLRYLPAAEVEKILARAPADQLVFLRARGQFELNRGAFKKAEQNLRRAVAADNRDHVTRFLLAMALKSQQKTDESRSLLQALLADPTLPDGLRDRVAAELR